MLGVDLAFDRVAYPTMLGLDYIITQFLFKGAKPRFSESVNNGQVSYQTHIYKVNTNGFINVSE